MQYIRGHSGLAPSPHLLVLSLQLIHQQLVVDLLQTIRVITHQSEVQFLQCEDRLWLLDEAGGVFQDHLQDDHLVPELVLPPPSLQGLHPLLQSGNSRLLLLYLLLEESRLLDQPLFLLTWVFLFEQVVGG